MTVSSFPAHYKPGSPPALSTFSSGHCPTLFLHLCHTCSVYYFYGSHHICCAVWAPLAPTCPAYRLCTLCIYPAPRSWGTLFCATLCCGVYIDGMTVMMHLVIFDLIIKLICNSGVASDCCLMTELTAVDITHCYLLVCW